MILPLPIRSIKANTGFSLVELLIALAVLAIILGFAVPNMRKMVLDNRVKSATNTLVAALHYARSEAVARNDDILFCAAAENESSTQDCAGLPEWDNFEHGAQIQDDGATFFVYRTAKFPNITIEVAPKSRDVGIWNFNGKGIFCDADGCHKTARLFIANEGYDGIARTICIGQFGQIKTLEGTKAEGVKTCP